MATAPYKVTFNWAGESLDQGKLVAVSFDAANIANESFFTKSLINQWTQASILEAGEAQKAALTVNKSNTIQLRRGNFVYMDVGCWLNGHQTFGLIWKDYAAVCSYTPAAAAHGDSAAPNLLDRFVSATGSSFVKNKLKIPGKNPQDDTLYLILPDMHVPESPPAKFSRPYDDGSWGTLKFGHWSEDPTAYDRMGKHDLFGSRKSIDAMVSFLNLVGNLNWVNQIALIQLGDMYELWAARDPFLKATPDDAPAIKIIPNKDAYCNTEEESIKQIASWIGDTHILYPEMFGAFDSGKFVTKTFLYGNHDSYLHDARVVAAANKWIQENYHAFGSLPTTVHPRETSYSHDGVFIEHGQRVDSFNRDGETSGFTWANRAAEHSFVKSVKDYFDPTRRETFVAGAAAQWISDKAAFGVYVQGHTHEADLNYVEVYNRREDTEVIYGPEGPTVLTTHKSLDGDSK